jgi:alkylation response protein AidB-like acyl-CoA dehydrogenase
MRLAFSAEDEEFRVEVRTWLRAHVPKEERPPSGTAMREYDLAWQQAQWNGGWAGVGWPTEYGGCGLSLTRQLIWFEEYARTGMAPIDTRFVGESHAGPTLIARASDQQKDYHLPKILQGDVVWCQGFSEPEAGSDLASLRTFAEIDGDELVVTGQKIWTSYAEVADWQELLVRTNRDVPKHKGITWVICDMRSPGVDVRPIRTLDGHADFAEVFYDDVRIPRANVVGEIDSGWSVAMSTLSFERGTAFTVHQVQLATVVEDLIELARERTGRNGRRLIDDDELARDLAQARADVASLQAMTYLGVSRNLGREMPGPEGSMLKLHWSELSKRVKRLAMDVIGTASLARSGTDARWVEHFLMSFSDTIAGGASEIQRNIIAERVLGLPR